MTTYDKFFVLLRLGLDCAKDKDHSLAVSADEWPLLYRMAQQHAVVGIVFSAIEKLPQESRPPRELLLQWFAVTERIKARNVQMNRKCGELHRLLESVGLDSCILKGQGIAQMYPDPLLRQSGDIDVWCRPHVVNAGNGDALLRKEVVKRLKATGIGKLGREDYMHIAWHIDDTEVEVHFHPSVSVSSFINRRMQRWFAAQAAEQMRCEILSNENRTPFNIPTFEFNAVYLLHHIYRHLFQEGIGLRQICDYCLLVKSRRMTEAEKKRLQKQFDDFGIGWFAKAMVHVLQTIFMLPGEYLLANPDKHSGRFVLGEILRSGNFGVADTKYKTASSNKLQKWTAMARRNFSFWKHDPSHVLWYVPFKLLCKMF